MSRARGLPRRTRVSLLLGVLVILTGSAISAAGVIPFVRTGQLGYDVWPAAGGLLFVLGGVAYLRDATFEVGPNQVRVGSGRRGIIERSELSGVGVVRDDSAEWLITLHRRYGPPVPLRAYTCQLRSAAMARAHHVATELSLPLVDTALPGR